MTVELGLTPDNRRKTEFADFADLVSATADAGFTAMSLNVEQANAAGVAALATGGLRCHEVLALVLSENAEATLSKAAELAEAAATARAPWVLTVFQPLNDESASVIRSCAAMFHEAGAKMAVEFSPLGGVPTISDALDVVEIAGADRAGVLIDTWHFFRGHSTWEQLECIPLEKIAYLQFNDAPPPGSQGPVRETMHGRVMPGDGSFELERFASTLLNRGWAGLVSVEVLSAELRQLPVEDFARLAYESTARYWR